MLTSLHDAMSISPLHRYYRHRSGHGDGGIRAHVTQIWLCVESQAFNIDSFSMSKFSTWDPTPDVYVSVGDAFDNSPNLVPGTIQAEHFDMGGEGKGYSDATPGNEKGVSARG